MITIPLTTVNNAEKLLEIANKLYDLYEKKMDDLPYGINIISELRANENANSRILLCLLRYSKDGHYPLLQLFIDKMQDKSCYPVNIEIKKPDLNGQENFIDILIKEKNKYAIIIENKIWNAPDTDEQIRRYVDYVLECKIPLSKIYVIYLTGDGSKRIKDYSLTEEARKKLKMTSKSDGRFICMNFKDDIIPWLKEISRLDTVVNEPLLSSAVIQYTDYLEEQFGLRNEDKKIDNQLTEIMMDKLNINNLTELLQTWDEVDKLNNLINAEVDHRIQVLCENKINKKLEKNGYSIHYSDYNYNAFHLQIVLPEWKKCIWTIRPDGERLFSGLYILEGRSIADRYLKKIISDQLYPNQNRNWVGWKWHDYYLNDEFWKELETHHVKFVNFIISEIERVREATNGMNL